ncbi:MAG TPA: SRPBCC domain-containing protein [Gemmatimonadales bacterium]|jgi:uncharacterized protein YndB with AHSA1/START domain
MTDDTAAESLVVRRVLPAPRERVFAAWLDPVSLAQWMRPGATTETLVEVDARVGGRFRILMRHEGNQDFEHRGEYLVIQPPSLLSFTWISAATDLQPTVVTVEFLERGANTELVLTHRRLPPSQLESHRRGWTDILRNLGDMLAVGQLPG